MKKTNQEQTIEGKKNKAVELLFKQCVEKASELLTIFESQKYRITVEVDHEKIGKSETLIKEFLSFYWNFTISKNKVGVYILYIAYDAEAIQKFGNRLHNQMLRAIFNLSMSCNTDQNIEDCVRVATEANDLRNYFYKRVMDGEVDNVVIKTEEPKAA